VSRDGDGGKLENGAAVNLWQRLFLTLGSTAAWLALAVLGWGSFAAFFSHPALVALVVVTVAFAVAGVFSAGNLSSGVREDRSNRWVVVAYGIIGLLAGYLPPLADRLGFWTFGGDALRWVGVVVFAVGCTLRLWPVFVLGNRFSGLVAIQPGHTLVTSGLYGVVRNPSYVGLLLTLVGWSLAFRSGVGLLLTACLVPTLVARMHAEERLLHEQFGAEYDAYRARTWRLIPWLY
jgi:protein-S-isoprenylcysteine O-methyltransferase Ste14